MGKKLAIGLLAAALVAVAGYFGVRYFSEREAVAEVEKAFAQLRAQGAAASFNAAVVDPQKQALTLSGVAFTSKDGAISLTVDQLTATGATPPRDGYAESDTLDLDGVSVTVKAPDMPGRTVTYLIPKAMIDRYRGPVAPVAAPEGESASAAYGGLSFALRQLAATSVAKITIPAMSARIIAAAGSEPVDVAYEGMAAEQVSAGKVRSLIVDSIRFSGPTPSPREAGRDGSDKDDAPPAPQKAGRVEGMLTGIVAARIDTGPILAAVSGLPAAPGQEGYQEIYGKVVTGPYQIKYSNGETSTAQSMLMEHVGIKPDAFTRERMEALNALSQKGRDLSMEEAGDLLERTTEVLDAVAFGALAMTDVRGTAPDESMRIASIRLSGFAAGMLDTFEMEGVEGHDAEAHPVKMARLAVHRLNLPAVVRLSKDADGPALPSLLGLFQVVSGVELSGVEVPYVRENGTAKPATLKVGSLNFSWGSFLGALPSTLRFEMSDVSGPISAEDGEPFTYLANAGITSATVSTTLNLAYDAQAQTLSLAPLSLTVKDAFSVELDAGVGNLPKETFTDAASAFAALARFNGRPVTLKIQNLGLAQLMIAQLAEAAGTTPETFRQDLISSIDEETALWAQVTRDAPAVAQELKAFVMNPKTLTLTATPRTNAPLMPLLSADQAFAVLQAFDITASAEP